MVRGERQEMPSKFVGRVCVGVYCFRVRGLGFRRAVGKSRKSSYHR